MVGLPRKPIKNEGYGEEGNSIERRDEEEMKKGSSRDESSKKQYA
jgi:hypothetical protein